MIKRNSERSESAMLADIVINAIQEKKGERVVKIDMRPINSPVADFFIVCQGNSRAQVEAIADSVEHEVIGSIGVRPSFIEGKENAEWMLIDYFDVVVHIYQPEARGFYKLESLWADADLTEINEPVSGVIMNGAAAKIAKPKVRKSNKLKAQLLSDKI